MSDSEDKYIEIDDSIFDEVGKIFDERVNELENKN